MENNTRNIFTSEFNIAFLTPKKDACRQCEAFQRKAQSREHKNKDKEAAQTTRSLKAITFDPEQVLTSTWCNVSSLYYSLKLNLYNLTLYELDTKDAHCSEISLKSVHMSITTFAVQRRTILLCIVIHMGGQMLDLVPCALTSFFEFFVLRVRTQPNGVRQCPCSC